MEVQNITTILVPQIEADIVLICDTNDSPNGPQFLICHMTKFTWSILYKRNCIKIMSNSKNLSATENLQAQRPLTLFGEIGARRI